MDDKVPEALPDIPKDTTEEKMEINSAMSTGSSGIGSSKSSETNSDTMSIGSYAHVPQTASSTRILNLCHKGDWMVLEQVLRGLDKGHSHVDMLSVGEEVSVGKPYFIAVRGPDYHPIGGV